MELVFNNLEWVRIHILVVGGGGGGGWEWGGVIPSPTSSIFDCVRLIYIAEITLSKESCFIKGMALFAVKLRSEL